MNYTIRQMAKMFYEGILAGLAPDDTNPKKWTSENRPKHEKEKERK